MSLRCWAFVLLERSALLFGKGFVVDKLRALTALRNCVASQYFLFREVDITKV